MKNGYFCWGTEGIVFINTIGDRKERNAGENVFNKCYRRQKGWGS
jgi:hypothetical protein